MRAAAAKSDEIATVRIELRDSQPLIWREVEVPTSITLETLHDIVQVAMGWFHSHLWEFTIHGRRYGLPTDDDEDIGSPDDASKVRLRDVLGPRKTKIDYTYDFGDSWEHRLAVSKVRAGDPGVDYPRYVAGQQNCPPEDCGGIPGFYETLAALKNPDDPGHADAKEWFADYDPHEIDEERIKHALGQIAKQRSAAEARPAKKSKPQSTD